ncbi:MAG: uroporphyrinogen decarboxylase [Planctomycetales bacterium]|nr:uroporphyrinogen decarboxylase [Planctomycetales bacterium]
MNASFNGLRIAALESRREQDVVRMIERFGGVAHVSPSMREAPIETNSQLVDFAYRLITGQVDAVILLTGVGVEHLVEQAAPQVGRQRLLDALSDVTTIARSSKPVLKLREFGVTPTYVAEEPNTWREVLALIDAKFPVANLRVAVQEYGMPNVSLTAGLEARGADVESVQVYRWELPEDLGPLQANVRRLAAGEIDVVLFTSAQQAIHLLQAAQQMELQEELAKQWSRVVVASVGPSTSEALRAQGVSVDFEPSHPKLGNLMAELAEQAQTLVERKRRVAAQLERRVQLRESQVGDDPWADAPFMRACRGLPTPFTPVWLMRQAGRYMAEYREVRAKTTFLELCRNPALCSEVMCTAVDKLKVDAAIIFSDLLPLLEPMGMELEFTPGDGPQIHNPMRDGGDVDRFLELESVDALGYVFETVAQTRRDLPSHIPLIGFAGAPFTLASYAIEGGSSRNFLHTKTLMHRQPDAWAEIMGRLARSIARYLNAQIAAGAQAVQIFDSWVGCLGPDDYRRFVMPYVHEVIEAVDASAPVIHFGTGNPALLPLMAEAGGDVIGVDWRIDLADAWKMIGENRAVQGNLDPTALLADRESMHDQAQRVLDAAAGRPGHIFNLGHGVLQQTPVDNAVDLVAYVHDASRR